MSEVYQCHEYELYEINGECYSYAELVQFIEMAKNGDGHQ